MVSSKIMLSSKRKVRQFIACMTLFALLFSLIPQVQAGPAPTQTDLLAGIPVSYVNSYQYTNPSFATDGNDTTSSDFGEYYHSYGFNLPRATDIGSIRIKVDDYNKFYAPVPIRLNLANGSIKDIYVTSNDYTQTINVKGVVSFFICVAQHVTTQNPLKVFTFEAYEMDTSAPTVPAISETNIGNGQVSFDWLPSTDNKGVAGYKVYKDNSFLANVEETSYTATGLSNAQAHDYTVSAYDEAGNESSKSESVRLQSVNEEPPAKPYGLEGSPEDNSVLLSWEPNTENDIAGYNVYLDGVQYNEELILEESYEINGLATIRPYEFEIEAVNTSELVSERSDSISVTPLNPNPPAIPTGLLGEAGNQHAELSWAANEDIDLAGYIIYKNGLFAEQVSAEITSYDAMNLVNGTNYTFSVAAINTSHHASEPSEDVSVTPVSNNAGLSSLTITEGTLDPVFESNEFNYTVQVSNDIESIAVTPTVQDRYATVTVNGEGVEQTFMQGSPGFPGFPGFPGMPGMPGMPAMPAIPGTPDTITGSQSDPIALKVGENTIDVIVTAQDGKIVNHYEITVHRAALSSDNLLKELNTSVGDLDPLFEANTTDYSLTVQNTIESITVTAAVSDTHAAASVNGIAVNEANISNPIQLVFGPNDIQVEVTAEDGTIKTYTIHVLRLPMPVPANITNLEETHTTTAVHFTFGIPADPDLSAVKVYMNGASVASVTEGVYNAEGLTPGTLYTFVFKSVNVAGTESTGITKAVTTSSLPPVVEPPVVVPPIVAPTPAPTPDGTPSPTPGSTQDKVSLNNKVNVETVKNIIAKAETVPSKTFSDVPAASWSAATIDLASRMGIVSGFEDGTFNPTKRTTRAEFAAMFVNALGLQTANDASFSDIKGHWAEDAILALQSNGIISGYADGSFKPDQTISRAEMVTMIAKVLNAGKASNGKLFSDIQGSWAQEAILTVADAGIVSGVGNDTFNPNAAATREQAVAMILRLLNVTLELGLKL
ncbi:S-layer homology domain-containing protein [Paenibacillus sp. 2TAB23]|uniref:S-layer homology domain-containing protein n=1 Tax=Paenibacillus sp. 2TAB23 TaxID=3233004 RepID=UPI003F9D528C